MIGLYITGILCGILYAILLKFTKYKGEPVPFVMELPNYRFPSARSVCQLIWEKARDFLQKAFTIIFVATVLIWFLQTFDMRLNVAASADKSLLAAIGRFYCSPVQAAGLWRLARFHRADHRLYGQGERCLYADGPSGRGHRRTDHAVYPVHGHRVSGVYPAVHALRGRDCCRQA